MRDLRRALGKNQKRKRQRQWPSGYRDTLHGGISHFCTIGSSVKQYLLKSGPMQYYIYVGFGYMVYTIVCLYMYICTYVHNM